MKFAVAALIATAAAGKDALGCEGADWDDWKGMRAESTCLFNKLHPNAAGKLQRGPILKFLENNCVMKEWAPTEAACHKMADQYVGVLMHGFGHDGEIGRDGFWKAYVTVKGETGGHKVPANIPPLDAWTKPAAMLGCPYADWGNLPEMRAQAKCYFKELHPNAAGNLTTGPLEDWVGDVCVMKGWASSKAKCDGMAKYYIPKLMNAFGHDGKIDKEGFWTAYVTVRAKTGQRPIPTPFPALDKQSGAIEDGMMMTDIDQASEVVTLTSIDEALEHAEMMTAKPFRLGCGSADWGNLSEMRTQSKCFFKELHPNAAGYLTTGPLEDWLSNVCLRKGWADSRAECNGMASEYIPKLMNAFGHDGKIGEKGFWTAYVTVRAKTGQRPIPTPFPALDKQSGAIEEGMMMPDIDQESEEVTLSDIENLDCTANGCTPNISRGSDQTDVESLIDEAFEHVEMMTAIDEAFEHVELLSAIDEAFEHIDNLNRDHHDHHEHHDHHDHHEHHDHHDHHEHHDHHHNRHHDDSTEVVETETHQDSDVPAIASVGALAAVAIGAGAFMMKKTFAAQNKSEEESLL